MFEGVSRFKFFSSASGFVHYFFELLDYPILVAFDSMVSIIFVPPYHISGNFRTGSLASAPAQELGKIGQLVYPCSRRRRVG